MNMPCSSRDCINSAVALAPQIHSEGHGGTLWKWVPACEEHLTSRTAINRPVSRTEEFRMSQHCTKCQKYEGTDAVYLCSFHASAPWSVRPVVDEGWWATGDE